MMEITNVMEVAGSKWVWVRVRMGLGQDGQIKKRINMGPGDDGLKNKLLVGWSI
ncbi:hypothetical protein Hanom_Chr14g01265011 [Helianthus anomalus]